MTEDEAKAKWCPFARVDSTASNRPNPGSYFDPEAGWPPCIGSACMAWRRSGSKFKDGRTGQLSDRDLTGNGTWIDVGFCGLAGAPQ